MTCCCGGLILNMVKNSQNPSAINTSLCAIRELIQIIYLWNLRHLLVVIQVKPQLRCRH